ncbi:efflux RND transporter periplasmic adaptor subunit [Methylobacterium sp. J-030]|uniref:efflux RND transporter periplasmic adaptor subunit n=1 Tax=Methylobacterium sp. J-030 TaxID=2836627 RepID=UPI001FBBAE36|nr:efflux RND transporter periplasmic adaptor subunit [Methylobacterium sp. J-030]MCJ2072964.1 efflux RND transporter periplasmic adaptor subunit [Methylobacterium sp. J-030]
MSDDPGPEDLEQSSVPGTVVYDLSRSLSREATCDGTILAHCASQGGPVRKGQIVLLVSSESLRQVQEQFIWLITEGRTTATRNEPDVRAMLRDPYHILAMHKFARSQIAELRRRRRPLDPVPILAPKDALLVEALPIEGQFASGTPLFRFAHTRVVQLDISTEAKVFAARHILTVRSVDAQLTATARVSTLAGDGIETVRLELLDSERRLPVGTRVAVELPPLKSNATAPVHGAQHDLPATVWPYVIPPRGEDRIRLGLAPPLPRQPLAPTRITAKQQLNPFAVSSRTRRTVAPFAQAQSIASPAGAAHRFSLHLSVQRWPTLPVSTASAELRRFERRWTLHGRIVAVPRPADIAVIQAPVAGTFVPRQFSNDTILLAGTVLGEIIPAPALIEAQQAYLAASGAPARASADAVLRVAGLTTRDLATLRRGRIPLMSLPIVLPINGLFGAHTLPSPRAVDRGAALVNVLPKQTFAVEGIVSTHSLADMPLQMRAAIRQAAAPVSETSIFNTGPAECLPVVESEGDATTVRMRVPLSTPAETSLAVDAVVEVTLTDTAGAWTALAVPSDCILPVCGAHEVLVHTARGALTPVSVGRGLTQDGWTEIIDGLESGHALVRDLHALAHAEVDIRAILGGFWNPNAHYEKAGLRARASEARPVGPLLAGGPPLGKAR